MPTPSPANRFPRRPLSSEIKKRLIAKSHGKCAICGATGVALDVSHILPLAFGGTNTESNLVLLCPNCHRSFDLRPHETEFIQYLATLLRADREYSSVQTEPLIKTAGRQLRPDLLAIRGTGKTGKRVLVECKTLSAFSFAQLQQVIEQLKAYKHALNPDELVLAFPGRIHRIDKERLVNESIAVWDLDYIANTFASAIAANPHPYFQALFQAVRTVAGTPREATLSEKLKACSPGTADWPVYQKLIGQILEHLFCPPLESPILQSADKADVNRRDYILPNYAEEGFWRFLRDRYAADYLVIDAKNSGKAVKKNDALQIANYLKRHGAGLFGIIMCRSSPDAGCIHTLREQWCHEQKMTLTINDDELSNMLLARSAGGRAEALLSTKLQEFRLSM